MPDQNVTSTEALPDGQAAQLSNGRVAVSLADIEHIGPGTLNGRYMRRFWHPVYHPASLGTLALFGCDRLGGHAPECPGGGGTKDRLPSSWIRHATDLSTAWP
jgi:hypothetical protein